FGRAYDRDVFNIVALSPFPMGAMEHKGLNIFNDALLLASPETATDQSFASIERVIAHEYFQLDGQPHHLPRLVPAVPEGGPDRLPRPGVLRRCALRHGRAHPRRAQSQGHAVPGGCRPAGAPGAAFRYIEINNFYTATVYNKGAEVVRMLHTLLGRDG